MSMTVDNHIDITIQIRIFFLALIVLTDNNVQDEKEQYATEVNNTALPLSSAVRTGLEPATSGVTGRHSNQLNYRTKFPLWGVASGLCSRLRMQSYNLFLFYASFCVIFFVLFLIPCCI